MKIILIADVKKLGKKGEVLEVKDGQARNYLIPNNLAIEANKKNLNDLNSRNESIQKNALQSTEAARKIAGQLEKERLLFEVKENSGKLFGSITTLLIHERLAKLGYEIDKRNIDLKKPINALGEFKVRIKLYSEVFANISIQVKPI
jgi:large subunit ribosomal protein L9